MRRVVVTGLGMVSPLGADVETSWRNILASKSGAGRITKFDPEDYACKIACEVKPADHEYGFDPSKRVDHKVQRQVDPFIVFGIDAAGQANYAASKAGLTGLSKALAQEVASRNITVNTVAPGFIRSAMTDALPEAQRDTLLGKIPAGRLGEGADVAAAIVYLASREAAYVTGQTIHVNGGMIML